MPRKGLEVIVSGDTSALERSFRRASRSMDSLGKQTSVFARVTSGGFSRVGLAATGMSAAIGGIAFAAKKAVDGASDINESITKNEVLFGTHSKTINEWSKTTARSMGISRASALAATGTFGNLFAGLGIGSKRAAEMSVGLTNLAADLASFNNASPEDALEAIRSGLVGETEPLRKFGVNLQDATLRAEALRMGLVKNTKEALDPQTKALAVNSLMYKQTEAAQGDFKRTSDGLANQQRILKATFTDVKDEIGTSLLPSFTRAVTAINRRVAPAVKGLAGDLGAIFDRKDLDLGEKLSKSAGAIKRNLGPLVGEIRDAIGKMQLGDKLGDAFQRAVPKLMDAAAAAAPKAAAAFVKAFMAAGVWGQLLTAAFLAKRMGGFKAAGSVAATIFTTRFGATASKELPGKLDAHKKGLEAPIGGFGKWMGRIAGVAFAGTIALALRDVLKGDGKGALGQYSGSKGWGELWRDLKDLLPGPDSEDRRRGGMRSPMMPRGFPRPRGSASSYPLGRRGPVIGTPGVGTHTIGDWQSDNAVDIRIAVGTPVLAIEDGLITKVTIKPNGGGRFAGSSVTLQAVETDYFYAHLRSVSVKAGQKVRAGQIIGRSGSANGVPHLHFGQERGDPRRTVSGRGAGGGGGSRPLVNRPDRALAGTGGGAAIPAAFLEAINRYGPMVQGIARKHGISGEALLAKLLQGESNFRMDTVSRAGARGAAQFMPGSRRIAMEKFGVDPWASPEQAVHGAALHLLGKINGTPGLRGYNPGDPNYPRYILGQKVGRIEDVDAAGRPERLTADDFARLAMPIVRRIINPFRSRIAGRNERMAFLVGREGRLEGQIGRTERVNALTDEDLSTLGGRNTRATELRAVLKLRLKRRKAKDDRLRVIKKQIADYRKIVKALGRQLTSRRVSRHLRPQIRKERDRRLDIIEDLVAEAAELGADLAEIDIDIEENRGEIDSALIGVSREGSDDGDDRALEVLSRRQSQTQEDLSTPEGRAARTSEIQELKGLKVKQRARKQARVAALNKKIASFKGRIKAQQAKLKKARGGSAARIRQHIGRLEERVIEWQAEVRSLGAAIEDIDLDLGDLDVEIGDVAEAAVPSRPSDMISQNLSDIDLMVRAGVLTPEQGRAMKISNIDQWLAGALGPLDQRLMWQLQGDRNDLMKENTQSQNNLADAINGLRDETARSNAIAESTVGIGLREAQRALADMISGQLGYKTGGRVALAGSGSLARY